MPEETYWEKFVNVCGAEGAADNFPKRYQYSLSRLSAEAKVRLLRKAANLYQNSNKEVPERDAIAAKRCSGAFISFGIPSELKNDVESFWPVVLPQDLER
jgi:hypothetical protein